MLPIVSICTPTFNRIHFIGPLIEMIRCQDYPKDRMEWLIADDGTDSIEDKIKEVDFVKVKYFKLDKQETLGYKRNFLNKQCSGDFIIYFDDDDYYPVQRISHGVSILNKHPEYKIAGSSKMHIYYHHINKIYQCGPYAQNHATAATFIFKKELLEQTSFHEESLVGEEKHFLKNYTIPLLQLDSLKTILVIAHSHNSFDKRKLLEDVNQYKMLETNYSLSDFIKSDKNLATNNDTNSIVMFYQQELHTLLANYLQGSIQFKPKVHSYIQEVEKVRNERETTIHHYKKATQLSHDSATIKEYEDKLRNKTCLIQKLIKELKETREELALTKEKLNAILSNTTLDKTT